MAIVIPPKGKVSETARRLIELADHVSDVRTSGNGTTFDVPDDLAERLYGKQAPAPAQTTAPAAPVRRRGRPPRVNKEEEGQS